MDSYYAATASTLAQPECHLHAILQPQALLALLVDRYLSRHLATVRNPTSPDLVGLLACGCLEVASCVVTFRNENIVVSATL